MSDGIITLNFKGGYTSMLLGGGIALTITGGFVYKNVPKIGDKLINVGVALILLSIAWHLILLILREISSKD